MAKIEKVSIADKLAALEKKTGRKIGSASHAIEPVTAFTTGNMVIDHLTGVGGIPKGRITQIAGEYSTGKTTVSLMAAVIEQRRLIASGEEGYILYLDHEHALDIDYMRALGIDTEHPSFITAQPNYIEEGQEIARSLLDDYPMKMIIWDSVGQMFPKARDESEFANRMAAADKGRVMKALVDTLAGPLAERQCAGILINHLYKTIATGYGEVSKDVMSGGKGKDYAASLNLKLKIFKKVKQEVYDEVKGVKEDRVQAIETLVIVDKNKVAPTANHQEVVRLQLGLGFDNMWSAVQVLKNNKRIVSSGAWNYFDPQGKDNIGHPDMPTSATGRPALQGEKAILDFAASHPEWGDRIVKIAEDVLKSSPTQLNRVLDTGEEELVEVELDNR